MRGKSHSHFLSSVLLCSQQRRSAIQQASTESLASAARQKSILAVSFTSFAVSTCINQRFQTSDQFSIPSIPSIPFSIQQFFFTIFHHRFSIDLAIFRQWHIRGSAPRCSSSVDEPRPGSGCRGHLEEDPTKPEIAVTGGIKKG